MAKTALETLLSFPEHENAKGVFATYAPAGIEMKFQFDFLYDTAKRHRFDEIIPLENGKILMLDGEMLPKMLGRVLKYDSSTGSFDMEEKVKDSDRVTLVTHTKTAHAHRRKKRDSPQ